jgi:hypothetical protein
VRNFIELDVKRIDPKYSMHQILSRIIDGLDILEEVNANQKEFKESLDRIRAKHEKLRLQQEDSSPAKKDGSIKLLRPVEQRFYDSYGAFWKSGKIQSTELVKSFERTTEFVHREPVTTNRLSNYVHQNRRI